MAFANLTTLFMFNIVIGLRSKYASLGAGRVLLMSVFLEVFFSVCFLLIYWHSGGYGFEELTEANLVLPV
jgi:formate hydrogenlyase subunit 4